MKATPLGLASALQYYLSAKSGRLLRLWMKENLLAFFYCGFFRKFIRFVFYFLWILSVQLTLVCTVASLEALSMIFFDAETKVFGTNIFLQQTSADLISGITFYCFVQSGETFTLKENTHTRTYTHNTHIHTHTHTMGKQIRNITINCVR